MTAWCRLTGQHESIVERDGKGRLWLTCSRCHSRVEYLTRSEKERRAMAKRWPMVKPSKAQPEVSDKVRRFGK